jgi:hypothetical protein
MAASPIGLRGMVELLEVQHLRAHIVTRVVTGKGRAAARRRAARRRHRSAPPPAARHLEHLRLLVDHRRAAEQRLLEAAEVPGPRGAGSRAGRPSPLAGTGGSTACVSSNRPRNAKRAAPGRAARSITPLTSMGTWLLDYLHIDPAGC